MLRIILFILLLTVVYSFEQFCDAVLVFLFRILKKHKQTKDFYYIDQAVGSLLVFATLPIGLAYWIATPGLLTARLVVVIIQLLAAAGLIFVLNDLTNPRSASLLAIAGNLVARPVKALFFPSRDQRAMARYALSLSIPLLIAVLIKLWFADDFIIFQSNLDQLILVALIGVFISITIKFLEDEFRLRRLHLMAYFRIVLGIIIIYILS
jgi:hypothetical protein